jgi:3D (Asp-Asp-Asp) domain-containing protein
MEEFISERERFLRNIRGEEYKKAEEATKALQESATATREYFYQESIREPQIRLENQYQFDTFKKVLTECIGNLYVSSLVIDNPESYSVSLHEAVADELDTLWAGCTSSKDIFAMHENASAYIQEAMILAETISVAKINSLRNGTLQEATNGNDKVLGLNVIAPHIERIHNILKNDTTIDTRFRKSTLNDLLFTFCHDRCFDLGVNLTTNVIAKLNLPKFLIIDGKYLTLVDGYDINEDDIDKFNSKGTIHEAVAPDETVQPIPSEVFLSDEDNKLIKSFEEVNGKEDIGMEIQNRVVDVYKAEEEAGTERKERAQDMIDDLSKIDGTLTEGAIVSGMNTFGAVPSSIFHALFINRCKQTLNESAGCNFDDSKDKVLAETITLYTLLECFNGLGLTNMTIADKEKLRTEIHLA